MKYKIGLYQQKYDEILNDLKDQYYEARVNMFDKDAIIEKLTTVMVHQERLLSYLRFKLKVQKIGDFVLRNMDKPVDK